ncbi:MAG: Lpg1974 family pore-forming outer membrane protein [Chlamydiota bacterium]|nr:Lpg1974 family pore-forming outer membrane protein [Chlamydiota bacterium]
MAKWNQKLGMSLLTLGLLAMTPNPVNAADDCASCDPCASDSCDSCFGGFEIAADFLFWKPCVDDLTYGASVSRRETSQLNDSAFSRTVKYKNICPEWEPGFRITVSKEDVWCGLNFSSSYTWLNTDDSSSSCVQCGTALPGWVESPLLHPELAPAVPDQELHCVEGHWDTTYQTWDVLMSYDICCNRCHTFSPFFGLAGLILDQSLKVDLYVDECKDLADSRHIDWVNDYFGVGFKIGSDYTYAICDGWTIFAMASGTIVAGDADNKYNKNTQIHYTDATGGSEKYVFQNPDGCVIVPGYHLQLGLIYESEFCGCVTDVRFGWEYLVWHNIANPRRFSEKGISHGGGVTSEIYDTSYSSQANTTTFGFNGLLVGMDLTF